MKEITPRELKDWKDTGKKFQLIDIREQHEVDLVNINGVHYPMAQLVQNPDMIKRDVPVVIHCKAGGRSAAVINELQRKYNFDNLYNLKGGINAYAADVDPSLPQY